MPNPLDFGKQMNNDCMPENEEEELRRNSLCIEDAICFFLNEYNQFKKVHENANEFKSIAKYEDEKKNIRPLVFCRGNLLNDNRKFYEFITAKIIRLGIEKDLKKRGFLNSSAEIKPVKNDIGSVEGLIIEICAKFEEPNK